MLRTLAVAFIAIVSFGRLDAGASPRTSWPSAKDFADARKAAAHPYVLVEASYRYRRVVVLAHREDSRWLVDHVFARIRAFRGCHEKACEWPRSLQRTEPLVEPRVLPERYRERLAYAQALLRFEPPLRVHEESQFSFADVPDDVWAWFRGGPDAPSQAPDLSHLLESLRRFYPMGSCSMDSSPQSAALLRGLAAAQAGRTGWAVQAWTEAVGYWSSDRAVWSSYGARIPKGHRRVLEVAGVDDRKLSLGLLLDVPGQPSGLSLSDLARLLDGFGGEMEDELRSMAADSDLDSWNRARAYAVLMNRSISDSEDASDEALFESLPPAARALIRHWESDD